jgi:hypothetical protein
MSSWITPKFHYNGNNFIPTYPPTGKVAVDKQSAVRSDSISSSGLRQSITERIDRVLTLEFPVIPEEDLNDWDAFISWILAAGQFDYYPDSSSGSHNTYQVVDTDLGPERVGYQLYKITLNLRRVVSAQIGS